MKITHHSAVEWSHSQDLRMERVIFGWYSLGHLLIYYFLFTYFSWCWGLNSGPCVCQASVIPMSYIPSPCSFIKKGPLHTPRIKEGIRLRHVLSGCWDHELSHESGESGEGSETRLPSFPNTRKFDLLSPTSEDIPPISFRCGDDFFVCLFNWCWGLNQILAHGRQALYRWGTSPACGDDFLILWCGAPVSTNTPSSKLHNTQDHSSISCILGLAPHEVLR